MNQESEGTQPLLSRSDRLRRLGSGSWSLLGIVLVSVMVLSALGALSGVVVPLVIAFIVGTVLDPMVRKLQKLGVAVNLAVVVGLLVALVVVALIGFIVIWGCVRQVPEIGYRIGAGWDYLLRVARDLDLDQSHIESMRAAANDYVPVVAQGILGALTHTILGLISFAMGLFFSMFFLFFMLRDGSRFPTWFAGVAKADVGLVTEIYRLSQVSIRGYLRGTALTAVITAPIFMIPLLLLRIPLMLPIFVLYFFLSFVPFLGAWITGAFAILIALGSGGVGTALIVLVCLLISNGTIQSTVNSWALGSSLRIHPVVVLLATMVGGSVAGILGMVLGPPLVSACERAFGTVKAWQPAHSNVLEQGLAPAATPDSDASEQ